MSPDDPEIVRIVRRIFREFSTREDRERAIESEISLVRRGFAKALCRQMEKSHHGPDRPGQQIPQPPKVQVGKYILKKPLGEGGMGQVWLAHDTVGDYDVALKILPESFRSNPHELERLRRSIQKVQGLTRNTAICQHRDIQPDPVLGYYLIMEYVQGLKLSEYRDEYERSHGSFPLTEMVRILNIVAGALDYAHGEQLIHCDIKPANILISADGSVVKIIDFQIAYEIRNTTSCLTQAPKSENPGTYCYMAPELWSGEKPTPWTDQYALAIMAFQLLDGHLPFAATDQKSWVIIATNPNTRIRDIDGIPPYANAALAQALHIDPKSRFDTCRQFVEALAGHENRETANFIKWRQTTAARDWVLERKCSWSHQDWILLLESLRRSEFWPMREGDVGDLVVQLRNDIESRRDQPGVPAAESRSVYRNFIFTSDPAIGSQVNVDGYPPLSNELLAAEIEWQQQMLLLKQVEDGIHPVLEAGRQRLTTAQREFDVLIKEHDSKRPRAAPGVLESITQALSQDPDVSFAKLSTIAVGLPSDELYGFVQRVVRSLEAKKDLQKAQRQTLIDRQALAEKLRTQIDATLTELKRLRDVDFLKVCHAFYDRAPGANGSFPTELWIRELPNIHLRRYGWTDEQIIDTAEKTFARRRDDLAFTDALREVGIIALMEYVKHNPNGRHRDEARAKIEERKESHLWKLVTTKGDRRSMRAYLAAVSESPNRAAVERRLTQSIESSRRANAIASSVGFGVVGAIVGGIVGALYCVGPIAIILGLVCYALYKIGEAA